MDSGIFASHSQYVGENQAYSGQAMASGGEMLAGALFDGELAECESGAGWGGSSGPEGGNAYSGAIAPSTAQDKAGGFTGGQAFRAGSVA